MSIVPPPPEYGHLPLPSQPKKQRVWPWIVLSLVLAMGACGGWLYSKFKKYEPIADATVQRFHAQFDAGEFETIVDESTEGFQAAAKREELIEFLSGVQRKLGRFKSTTRGNLQLNAQAGIGTFVIVEYTSEYEHGTATETFTLLATGAGARLHGYNVGSPLLLKP